jgi:peptidoglycan hydrolase-like protein with peptidoglycan-binding domain
MTVLVADVSEFQPDVDDATYLAWSKAVIFRALYGTVVDKAWYGGQRRRLLHQGGAVFVGIYAYITEGESPVTQARALLNLIGSLRPGEKLIADLEEGVGIQTPRWNAWAATIKAATGEQPWLYSDLGFARAHGLVPDWLADFPTLALLKPPTIPAGEPSEPHVLWQFSENYQVPGIASPCDCSVYHESIDELAALAYQPGAPLPLPAPKPAPAAPEPETIPDDWQEQIMTKLPTLKLGDKDDKEPWMVRRVQGLVDALGPDCARTGVFDAPTETAVKAFQKNHGITADGVVGPVTWSMLITGSAA